MADKKSINQQNNSIFPLNYFVIIRDFSNAPDIAHEEGFIHHRFSM